MQKLSQNPFPEKMRNFQEIRKAKVLQKFCEKIMQNFAEKDKTFRIQDAYFRENFCTFLQNIFLLEILHMIHHSKALMPYM